MTQLLLSVLALLLVASQGQAAPVGAVSFTDTGISPGSPGGVTDGWQFNVLTPINVTHLGFYDVGGDGFAESHEVGLWTDAGILLASATVTPADALEADLFRYVSILPVTLEIGTYRVGGFRTDADDSRTSVGAFSTAPEIQFLLAVFSEGAAFDFPSSLGGESPGIFGASFKAEAVPEPATVILLGLCGVGALLTLRRRVSIP